MAHYHNRYKRAKLTADLQPTINSILSELNVSKTNEAHFILSRPYLFVYAGGDRTSYFASSRGVIEESHLNFGDIRTVILLMDKRIDSANYQSGDNPNIGERYYRDGYYLWAFDNY